MYKYLLKNFNLVYDCELQWESEICELDSFIPTTYDNNKYLVITSVNTHRMSLLISLKAMSTGDFFSLCCYI